MYLILKAYAYDSRFEGDRPDLAIIDLEKQREHLEKCSQLVKRLHDAAGEDPKPTRLTFAADYFAWLRYDERLEECDFYSDVENGEGVALAKALPEFLAGPEESDLDVSMETPSLVVDGKDTDEVFFRSDMHRSGIGVRTVRFSLDDLNRLQPYEGVLMDDDLGPGR